MEWTQQIALLVNIRCLHNNKNLANASFLFIVIKFVSYIL